MKIINLFNSIRDIPYSIPLTLTENTDDCLTKHRKLLKMLEEQEYQARFRMCAFQWSALPIPPAILAIPHGDYCDHLFLEVLIENNWIRIDATWDSGLRNILPIAEWDGVSDTAIAVPVIDMYDPERSAQIMGRASVESFMEDIKQNGAFYKAFNEWLEENRV